jgi:hypothetical protein
MTRRMLRWRGRPTPVPAHPYRDSLIVFAGMAAIIVVFGWATGGGLTHAIIIAAAFFVAANLYNIGRWHSRLSESRRRDEGEL